jgi:hypothetical protein
VSVPPQEKNHWAPDTVAHDPQNLDQLLYADLTGLGSWSHGLAWSPEQTLTHIVGALEPGSFAAIPTVFQNRPLRDRSPDASGQRDFSPYIHRRIYPPAQQRRYRQAVLKGR